MEVSAVLVEAAAMPAGPADPDAPLVAAAREEPREFPALYDRYFERVLGYVRLGIRDAATCEDVASTVFTTALAQLPRFRGRAASRVGCSRSRGMRCGRQGSPRRAACRRGGGLRADVEERFLARERAAQLHALIRTLEPEQQHLLALRYGAGLAFDEIGLLSAPRPDGARPHAPDS